MNGQKELERHFPSEGQTDRLIIKNSVLEECETLQLVNEASDYIENWVGWKTPSNYAFLTLTDGNLPPEGKKEQFYAKSIYIKQTNEIIGALELYNGYPTPEVLWIGWLFILPKYQRAGYAKEVVKYICAEAKQAGFEKVRLGVHLKNWPALRFWHAMGFDKIIKIAGDEVYSETTFASAVLEKALN